MKNLYIETYGCQMNVADSEVVASVMRMAGYEPCTDAGSRKFRYIISSLSISLKIACKVTEKKPYFSHFAEKIPKKIITTF